MVLAISSVTPVTGKLNEATTITLSGTDFGAGATVMIGDTLATNILVSGTTQITCVAPNTLEEDNYDVSITVGTENAILQNGFIVVMDQPEYPYRDEDFPTVHTRILNRFPDYYEKFEGSGLYDLIAPVSLEFTDIYLSLSTISNLMWVLTAPGAFLEYRGIEYGVLRRKATKAKGTVKFTGTGLITIPKDTRVSNSPSDAIPESIYVTDKDVTLEVISQEYTSTVDITAVDTGKQGNLGIGAINRILSNVTGLTAVTNAAAIILGSNREEIEAYRSRILSRILTPARSGNAEHYKQWALEASEYIGKVGVDPLRKDENSGTKQPGEVGIYILAVDGSVPSADLIKQVTNYIGPDDEGKGQAPIGANPNVSAPAFVDTHVRVVITVSSGFVKANLLSIVKLALQNHINELNIGANVRYHNIGTLISNINGIDSISAYFISSTNTSPVDTEVADIDIDNTQKARAGTITVA